MMFHDAYNAKRQSTRVLHPVRGVLLLILDNTYIHTWCGRDSKSDFAPRMTKSFNFSRSSFTPATALVSTVYLAALTRDAGKKQVVVH